MKSRHPMWATCGLGFLLGIELVTRGEQGPAKPRRAGCTRAGEGLSSNHVRQCAHLDAAADPTEVKGAGARYLDEAIARRGPSGYDRHASDRSAIGTPCAQSQPRRDRRSRSPRSPSPTRDVYPRRHQLLDIEQLMLRRNGLVVCRRRVRGDRDARHRRSRMVCAAPRRDRSCRSSARPRPRHRLIEISGLTPFTLVRVSGASK